MTENGATRIKPSFKEIDGKTYFIGGRVEDTKQHLNITISGDIDCSVVNETCTNSSREINKAIDLAMKHCNDILGGYRIGKPTKFIPMTKYIKKEDADMILRSISRIVLHKYDKEIYLDMDDGVFSTSKVITRVNK